MAMPKKERRKQPRAKGTTGLLVGLESQTPGDDIRDISLSGVCFTVEEPLEFMTQLMMTLIFPTENAPAQESGGAIQCEGAVVRCEPIDSDAGNNYEVAVFFTRLEEAAKAAIEEYVKTF